MNRSFLLLALVAGSAMSLAHAESVQYVSDDISITMRAAARNDAPVIGSVRSGQRLVVLEVLGADSFARVRGSDGREGWITARYLSKQPAAKDRVAQIKTELDAAQAQIKSLGAELSNTRAQLEKARPALELSADNDRLKNELAAKEHMTAALAQRYDAERERRATLVTGATLVGGGILAGLLLPWLLQLRRRRRRGDF